MAQPPEGPPNLPPRKPSNPADEKSFSEDLSEGFAIAPNSGVRSIDAEGQVERVPTDPGTSASRSSSPSLLLLDLPDDGEKLELADRPASTPQRTASRPRVGAPQPKLRRSPADRRWMLLTAGGMVALTAIVLVVLSMATKRPQAPAETGIPLSVDSVPAGADIFVDGHETGQKTPATLASWDWLIPHEIELKLAGRTTFQQTIPEGPHPPPLRAVLAPVAFLDLQTTPPGAEVRRGDYKIGVTPGHLELKAGEKDRLTLVLAGYLPSTVEIEATPGELRTQSVPLLAAGTLSADSDPSGVSVEIDGRPAGETPLQIDLEAGRTHQIRFFADRLIPEERKIVLAAGKVSSLTVLLGDKRDRELRAQFAATDRRLRAVRAEMQRLDNPRQSREFFQTMARTQRRAKLESELDALETKSDELQGALESHRSELEDLVEGKATSAAAAKGSNAPPAPPTAP
jgi:hypothetical protein